MGVYIFDADYLYQLLEEDHRQRGVPTTTSAWT